VATASDGAFELLALSTDGFKVATIDSTNKIPGSYYLDNPNRFVVTDGGFNEATIDTAAGKTTLKSLAMPAACTKDGWDRAIRRHALNDDTDKVPKKCAKAIAVAQTALWKKSPLSGFVVAFDGKRFRIRHDDKPALLVLDAGVQKPKALALPVCSVR
jgi:hypothetical protein